MNRPDSTKVLWACGFAALTVACPVGLRAAQIDAASDPGTVTTAAGRTGAGGMSRVGVAVRMSTLGVGLEVATPVHARANVRFGVNLFRFTETFNYHGIDYAGSLTARSVETHFDWFVFGGNFHVSPGVMLYNGNRAELNATVSGDRVFSLGEASYLSDRNNPVAGSLRVEFQQVSPTLLVGWGNLIPRGDKRFSMPLEVGVVLQGAARASLRLGGSACHPSGVDCRNIGSDSRIQSDVLSEQDTISSHESSHVYLRFYPVASVGFSYRF